MTDFTDEQRRNAAIIAAVGRQLGASDRDITIALATAMQESELRNIDYGDQAGPDSRGLFQQRDAWGSLAERMDPASAARMFFTGGHDGQRGLFDIKDRDRLSLTQAAQAVQVSAFPDAYAKHEGAALELLGSLGGNTGGLTPTGPGPAMSRPAVPTGTVTVNPTDDQTVRQTDTLLAAAAKQATPGSYAGLGDDAPGLADDAPGLADDTPGLSDEAAGLADPGAAATPSTALDTLDPTAFQQLFPDAAANRLFSGPVTGTTARRADAITSAMSFLGTPYVWGGADRSGVDCSGLVEQVYHGLGIDLPRLSADQIRAGQAVSADQLQPGDLIGWDNSTRNQGADHIAIYAGDGYIIEAPKPGLWVRRRKLSDAEMANALGAHFAQLG